MIAVKPVYSRSTKTYSVQVVPNADPMFCFDGYMVFDDAADTLRRIKNGTMLQSWSDAKVEAIKKWLVGILSAE